jgi:mono/diheme cytochrome c family protein
MRIKQTAIVKRTFSARGAVYGLGCMLVGALAALLLSAPLLQPSVAAAENGGAAAKRGEAMFKQRCIACHNKQLGDTTPFGPPNLNGIFRGPNAITTKDAAAVISDGKGQMPGWGKVLTKGDIDDLLAYLKTLSPPDPATK